MGFCKTLVKTIVSFFAIIILLMSAGIIAAGIYLKSNKPEFWNDVGADYNNYY